MGWTPGFHWCEVGWLHVPCCLGESGWSGEALLQVCFYRTACDSSRRQHCSRPAWSWLPQGGLKWESAKVLKIFFSSLALVCSKHDPVWEGNQVFYHPRSLMRLTTRDVRCSCCELCVVKCCKMRAGDLCIQCPNVWMMGQEQNMIPSS